MKRNKEKLKTLKVLANKYNKLTRLEDIILDDDSDAYLTICRPNKGELSDYEIEPIKNLLKFHLTQLKEQIKRMREETEDAIAHLNLYED